VYELLKPQRARDLWNNQEEDDHLKAMIDRFSRDLTVALKNSEKKAVDHVKKQYQKD
jgi:hypothetical protein